MSCRRGLLDALHGRAQPRLELEGQGNGFSKRERLARRGIIGDGPRRGAAFGSLFRQRAWGRPFRNTRVPGAAGAASAAAAGSPAPPSTRADTTSGARIRSTTAFGKDCPGPAQPAIRENKAQPNETAPRKERFRTNRAGFMANGPRGGMHRLQRFGDCRLYRMCGFPHVRKSAILPRMQAQPERKPLPFAQSISQAWVILLPIRGGNRFERRNRRRFPWGPSLPEAGRAPVPCPNSEAFCLPSPRWSEGLGMFATFRRNWLFICSWLLDPGKRAPLGLPGRDGKCPSVPWQEARQRWAWRS